MAILTNFYVIIMQMQERGLRTRTCLDCSLLAVDKVVVSDYSAGFSHFSLDPANLGENNAQKNYTIRKFWQDWKSTHIVSHFQFSLQTCRKIINA